jgi:hypothetical protein
MGKLDELAESLAVRFQRDIPNVGGGKGAKKLSTQELDKRLDRFYLAARQTRKENRLWLISWARVVLKLKQKLLLAGYPADFVSKLIMSTLLQAQKKAD